MQGLTPQAAQRNLELKAVDPDPPRTLEAALALDGVEDRGVLVQRDTYFYAVQGRLKLRETWQDGIPTAELISYARADRHGPKVSHYRVVPVYDPAGMLATLSDALGVRVVVEKERRLLLWHGVRIHLDRVAKLGDFVEFEAVAQGVGGLQAEEVKVQELRAALGLTDDGLLVARGYAELLGA